MLGLELTRADFDFTTDALHDLNTEQVCRIMGLCIDFAKVIIDTFVVMVMVELIGLFQGCCMLRYLDIDSAHLE